MCSMQLNQYSEEINSAKCLYQKRGLNHLSFQLKQKKKSKLDPKQAKVKKKLR